MMLRSYNGQPIPGTDQVFRLNWAAYGVGKAQPAGEGAARDSCCAGPSRAACLRAIPMLNCSSAAAVPVIMQKENLTAEGPVKPPPAALPTSASSCAAACPYRRLRVALCG